MKQYRQGGFTLIEVLIAVAVFAIGILAAAGLQATSLRSSAQAEVSRTANQLLSAEMEHQRQSGRASLSGPTAPSAGGTCGGVALPGGYGCEVELLHCAYDTTSRAISCGDQALAEPKAYYLTVVVTPPGSAAPLSLSSLVRAEQ